MTTHSVKNGGIISIRHFDRWDLCLMFLLLFCDYVRQKWRNLGTLTKYRYRHKISPLLSNIVAWYDRTLLARIPSVEMTDRNDTTILNLAALPDCRLPTADCRLPTISPKPYTHQEYGSGRRCYLRDRPLGIYCWPVYR